jgi:hypothetical protein
MIDLNELGTALETSLDEELGTYTFSNGLSTAAIRVDDGSDPFDEEPAVDGLECVIQQAIDVPIRPLLGGDYQQDWATAIVLKQWDIERTTLVGMHLALEALAEFSFQLAGVRRVVRSSRLDNIETCTISLIETEVISV